MTFTKLTYEVTETIAWITLHSPKNLNAFDEQMDLEVIDALRLCEENKNVRAVIISGFGKSFSGGGDIGSMYAAIKKGNPDFRGEIYNIARISMAIKQLSKPVIAAVHGAVAGAAFNIVLSCDYCIAEKNTVFIQAFVNIGLIPDAGGLFLLSRSVGVNKAAELAMTGRPVTADEGLQLGFVAQITDGDDLAAAAKKQAEFFSHGPAASYAEIKRLIWEAQFKDMPNYVEEEIKSQLKCGDTDDFKEGICAFVEKRKPQFQS